LISQGGERVTKLNQGRWTADIEGDFVVFIIAARLNNKLRIRRSLQDLGGRRGMNHMLQYVVDHPEKGLLGFQGAGATTIQYWRSYEHLEAFAKDKDDPHLAPWRAYVKRVGKTSRTEIWHETYLVRAGEYEDIYTNMPTFGLAKASKAVRVSDSSTARNRLKSRH
jgi:hypothetical protein